VVAEARAPEVHGLDLQIKRQKTSHLTPSSLRSFFTLHHSRMPHPTTNKMMSKMMWDRKAGSALKSTTQKAMFKMMQQRVYRVVVKTSSCIVLSTYPTSKSRAASTAEKDSGDRLCAVDTKKFKYSE